MGTIVVSENVSLDGVMQDPTGEEGFSQGGWFGRVSDTDRAAWAKVMYDEALAADALLLGRRSDEWFAARWSARSGAWADRLNGLPKYVVSSTLAAGRWSNSTVLRGDPATVVAELKRSVPGEIVVNASGQLVRALLAHGLVDELRLTVYPCVLGAGQRLFDDASMRTELSLTDSRQLGESLVLLTYQRRVLPRSSTKSRDL
jgi:dihydrofolate reductase